MPAGRENDGGVFDADLWWRCSALMLDYDRKIKDEEEREAHRQAIRARLAEEKVLQQQRDRERERDLEAFRARMAALDKARKQQQEKQETDLQVGMRPTAHIYSETGPN